MDEAARLIRRCDAARAGAAGLIELCKTNDRRSGREVVEF
jgi:hypothetical protein